MPHILLGESYMVSDREVEESMLQIFPTCPICGSNRGYAISGMNKTYAQCRSCKAKWHSSKLPTKKKVEFLDLREPSKEGIGSEIILQKKGITFWKNYNERMKNIKSTIDSDDQTLRNKTVTSLNNLKGYEVSNLGQLSMIFSGNTAEHAMTKLLKAIVDQNNIIIMQNEMILRAISQSSKKELE